MKKYLDELSYFVLAVPGKKNIPSVNQDVLWMEPHVVSTYVLEIKTTAVLEVIFH